MRRLPRILAVVFVVASIPASVATATARPAATRPADRGTPAAASLEWAPLADLPDRLGFAGP